MAKECAVCGKTISLLEKSVKLKYAGAHLCAGCGREATDLFLTPEELPGDADEDYVSSLKTDFYKKLSKTSYKPYIKSLITDHFMGMLSARTGSKLVIRKYFRAGFEESCEIVRTCCNKISDKFIQLNPQQIGDVNQCTFVCETIYVLRSSSFVGLYAEVLSTGNLSVITVASAGGGNGMVNEDWGSEKAFVRDFWNKVRECFAGFMEREIVPENPCNFKLDQSMTLTNRIGVLGGTFDPIHLGHKALGEAALREGNIDKLIVMPARVQPFKQGKKVAEVHHRFEMCRLTFEDNEKVEISDYELANDKLSYTYDTLRHLQGVYPDKKIVFIMGTDSYLMLEDWYKGMSLLENFAFIVGDRPGYREAELDAAIVKYHSKYGTETIKITADMPDISATEIREALKADETASELVTKAVERYIRENGLYI